ncbi:MAG TPA: aldehyde dehydrogenase family protein, partial [Burkholderiaceae bacterium]
RALPVAERARLVRKVGDLMEQRVYEIAAALTLEVGKNRMEALGEVAEVSAFFDLYAQQMEDNAGYDRPLPDDPLPDFKSRNRSVLKAYGVWAVVSPFNYPFALAGGPVAAALVAGNTVVLKGALDTPWSAVLLDQCLHDAGLPPGVFNFLIGGSDIGDALIGHDGIDGVTFTGSHRVGMHILRRQVARDVPRPCIAEMGGKNAVVVSAQADLDVAAQGIVRSAFGMSGQKCSALSRLYVAEPVADALIERIRLLMDGITMGCPQDEATWIGPVTTRSAHERHRRCGAQLSEAGSRVLAGGDSIDDPARRHGFFCAPTLAQAPLDHPLWHEEMFAPIAMLARVQDVHEAMRRANDSRFGLTAGFFGAEDEVPWFFEHIEAGVTYANRPQGATTGAWPGYQPFGGWKGSGSTGKALASFHYLPQYMREQSQTRIEP